MYKKIFLFILIGSFHCISNAQRDKALNTLYDYYGDQSPEMYVIGLNPRDYLNDQNMLPYYFKLLNNHPQIPIVVVVGLSRNWQRKSYFKDFYKSQPPHNAHVVYSKSLYEKLNGTSESIIFRYFSLDSSFYSSLVYGGVSIFDDLVSDTVRYESNIFIRISYLSDFFHTTSGEFAIDYLYNTIYEVDSNSIIKIKHYDRHDKELYEEYIPYIISDSTDIPIPPDSDSSSGYRGQILLKGYQTKREIIINAKTQPQKFMFFDTLKSRGIYTVSTPIIIKNNNVNIIRITPFGYPYNKKSGSGIYRIGRILKYNETLLICKNTINRIPDLKDSIFPFSILKPLENGFFELDNHLDITLDSLGEDQFIYEGRLNYFSFEQDTSLFIALDSMMYRVSLSDFSVEQKTFEAPGFDMANIRDFRQVGDLVAIDLEGHEDIPRQLKIFNIAGNSFKLLLSLDLEDNFTKYNVKETEVDVYEFRDNVILKKSFSF
jgi:hypothetical protein